MKQRWIILCLLCLAGCNLSIDPTPGLPGATESPAGISAEFISDITPAQPNSSTGTQAPRATNPVLTPTPTIPCATPAGWEEYAVKRGDTVSTIASRVKTTIAILAQANCLSNPNALLVGQILLVPPPSMTVTP